MEFEQNEPFINSNMWIIAVLPKRLPGRVRKKLDTGRLFIEPLVDGLPLKDGGIAQEFFAFEGDAFEGNYVTFCWQKPGERSFNAVKNEYSNPRAIDVNKTDKDEAERCADNIRERLFDELRRQLKQQQDELDQEQERLAQQVEELAQKRTQYFRDELNRKAKELAERENIIDEKRQELNEQQVHIESLAAAAEKAEHLWMAIESYRAVIPLVNRDEDVTLPTQPCPIPDNLGVYWNEMLRSSSLILPEYIGTSYLLSLVSAFYSGSLILLNGSVGVGKTSLIRVSAELLGGSSKIIPVRPAWLDPSDLLGFFDPLSEIFRPSPFLTALKEAEHRSDRLHLVCLDELNLAKIENYGADLLSALEYSRSEDRQQGLLLYSSSIETDLWEEAKLLHDEQQQLDNKQLQRLRKLQNLLRNYPSNFSIPRNLVVVGTLNADETTYDLSPKVIDRSFVITYPPANLAIEEFSETLDPKSISKDISISTLLNEMSQRVGTTMDGWGVVVKWNAHYLSQLGIPLGHRAKRDYAVFSAAATCLGLTKDDCLGHFIATKLLPRISFFKSSPYDQVNREELCRNWFNELDNYPNFGISEIIAQMQEQLDDDRRRNVRYWG